MRQTTSVILIAALLCGGSTLGAKSAFAQQPSEQQPDEGDQQPEGDQQRFRELGRAGAEAFAAKDYAAAEEAFKAAYAIRPVPNLLYNIGRALEKQGDFEAATAYYERFVNEPDVELQARRDALQRLKTLREVLALREEGREVDQEQVEEDQGDHDLAETADAEAVDPEAGAAEPAAVEKDYTLAYILGGAGAAALIGGGVFAGLAAMEKSDFDDAATLAERRSAAESGQTYTTVADSMLITGAVLGAAGIYFWVTAPDEAPAGAARLAPSVGPGGASVTFTLDF